jgi:hypothetical protein
MGGINKHFRDQGNKAVPGVEGIVGDMIAGLAGKPKSGGVIGDMIAGVAKASSPDAKIGQLQQQVAHLSKLVHILWKEAEKLESYVRVIPEGLRIKAGLAEVLVLKNGGIILDGQRISLKTPGKSDLMF